jgi:hypothetical protein
MTANGTRWLMAVLALTVLVAALGCGGRQVYRMDEDDTMPDLSGGWSVTDSEEVAEVLHDQMMEGAWWEDFRSANGRTPYLIIDNFRNKTADHIPMKSLIQELENDFINGRNVRMVASAEERESIRAERADQQEFSSTETMSRWGREHGADYILIGEINQIYDAAGDAEIFYYQVNCYLVDLEDNVKVWAGNHKIKKFVGSKPPKGM